MFSGIIEDLGEIVSLLPRGNGATMTVRTALRVDDASMARGEGERPGLRLGDSVAVNGACLTVEVCAPPDRVSFAVGRETLDRTGLGALRVGDRVHLERALRLGDRLDGHMVSGHVDGVGELVRVVHAQESVVLWVRPPAELARYIAVKGSICLDGVSLTVNELDGLDARVNIVPYSAAHTRLGTLRSGARLNIEVDLIARYLERLLGARGDSGLLTRERLEALGFASPARER